MKKVLVLFALVAVSFGFVPDEKMEKAPEIELAGPDGEIVKLSSLKGKMVLIDFWASWCRPCRMENPHVVEAYLQFKDEKFENGKGFEVYSISLDRSKEKWVKAIEADELIWPSHVLDNKGAVAREFNVRTIPSAFLIDGKGNIVAQGNEIRGNGLQNTLKELLK